MQAWNGGGKQSAKPVGFWWNTGGKPVGKPSRVSLHHGRFFFSASLPLQAAVMDLAMDFKCTARRTGREWVGGNSAGRACVPFSGAHVETACRHTGDSSGMTVALSVREWWKRRGAPPHTPALPPRKGFEHRFALGGGGGWVVVSLAGRAPGGLPGNLPPMPSLAGWLMMPVGHGRENPR